jgi:hypothetical protein
MIGIYNINYLPFEKGDIIEKIYKEYPLLVTPSKNFYTEKEANVLFPDSINYYYQKGILKKVILTKSEFIDLLNDETRYDDKTALNALLVSINKDNFFNYYVDYAHPDWTNMDSFELRKELGIVSFFEVNSDFKISLLIIFFGLLVVGFISFIIEPFITEKTKIK